MVCSHGKDKVLLFAITVLCVGKACATGPLHKEQIFKRNSSFDHKTPNKTELCITTVEGIDQSMCFYMCLRHLPKCVSLLYSGNFTFCNLLTLHLSDKILSLTSNTSDEGRWEYWANVRACDEGWVPFNGHCYYLDEREATWDEAVAQCEQRTSYLIEMNSDLESIWITESFLLPVTGVEAICPHFFSCSVWVGARSELPPDEFLWKQSEMEVVFPQWAPNQPNSGGGVPACIVLQRDGTGNDMYCTKTFQFICEKE